MSFRDLERAVGRGQAWATFGILWTHLTQQTRTHGKSGIYSGKLIHALWHDLAASGVGLERARDSILSSGLLEASGDDFYCQLFFCSNPEMDSAYIPNQEKWQIEWDRVKVRASKSDAKTIDRIPQFCWYITPERTIPASSMHRAWVLIETLDIITRRKSRKPETLSAPMALRAAEIVMEHSEAKLSLILKRYLSMMRPYTNPLLPHNTEDALKRFDDLILAVIPVEGFEKWLRNVESPPIYELPKQRPDPGIPIQRRNLDGRESSGDPAVVGSENGAGIPKAA